MQKVEKSNQDGDWWSNINWTALVQTIKTFQERIARASWTSNEQETQKLMIQLVKSESAKLLAIYYITQKNRGRYTSGIDGKTYLTPEERMNLSNENFDYKKYRFRPVIKKEIPKKKRPNKRGQLSKNKALTPEIAKKRPLGIMAIKDRVMAKIISFALTAKWEPLFESNVMGYRPGRGRQDAIDKICNELKGGEKVILEADIKKFFENIKHEAILDKIEAFHGIIRRILKIKVMENGKISKMSKGIVQGNPLSPVLANIALHGMQQLIETKTKNGKCIKLKQHICLVRYADDFIVIAPSRQIINNLVLPKLERFLKKRGLTLNKEKSRIVSKQEGFTFLGYSIKQKEIIAIIDSSKKN